MQDLNRLNFYMCLGIGCNVKRNCLRHTARANKIRRWTKAFKPNGKDCEGYIEDERVGYKQYKIEEDEDNLS